MKKISIASVVLLACFGSTCSYAGWTEHATVNGVYSHGGYHVFESSIPENKCGTNGKFWWPVSGNEDANSMLSISLTALTAGKDIRVHSSPTTDCKWGAQRATHIHIKN